MCLCYFFFFALHKNIKQKQSSIVTYSIKRTFELSKCQIFYWEKYRNIFLKFSIINLEKKMEWAKFRNWQISRPFQIIRFAFIDVVIANQTRFWFIRLSVFSLKWWNSEQSTSFFGNELIVPNRGEHAQRINKQPISK